MIFFPSLGVIEKDNFVSLLGKGGHSGLMSSKLCVPAWGMVCEKSSRQEADLLTRIRVCAGPAFIQSRYRLAFGGPDGFCSLSS